MQQKLHKRQANHGEYALCNAEEFLECQMLDLDAQ